jgi:hypothetical protein
MSQKNMEVMVLAYVSSRFVTGFLQGKQGLPMPF